MPCPLESGGWIVPGQATCAGWISSTSARRHCALPIHDLVQSGVRHTETLRSVSLRNPKWDQEILQKHLTGCVGRRFSGKRRMASSFPRPYDASVIVDDLHVLGASFRPTKADPVLIVDPDRVLTASVPLQALKTQPRERQRAEGNRRVQPVENLARFVMKLRGEGSPRRLRVLAVEDVITWRSAF